MIDAAVALRAVQTLFAAGLTISALELIWLQRHFGGRGLLALAAPSRFQIFGISLLQLGIAAVLATQMDGWLRTAALVLLQLLPFAMLRNLPFGSDGSEQMMRLGAGALLLQSFVPGDPQLRRACLWFIAVQSVCAYATAGYSKLLMPAWRDGRYLKLVLSGQTWSRPFAARLAAVPGFTRWLSFAVIGYECAAPLALLTGVPGAAVFCGAGLLFHAGNAVVMGLNLFVWSFAATYPAILFCAQDIWRIFTARSAS